MDILVLYTMLVAASFGATEKIYAGKGWNERGTIMVVPVPVTWYAAAKYDIGFTVNRPSLLKHIAKYISSGFNFSDPLIWIGAITSENDGLLYNIGDCEAILNFYGPYTCGERKCVALNVTGASQNNRLQFVYDDCMNHHSFITYSPDYDHNFSEETRTKVTVGDNIDLQSNFKPDLKTSESCYTNTCMSKMMCVASFFDFEMHVCLHYIMDRNEDIADKQQFTLIKNSSVNTVFSWKSWQRGFDDQQLNEDACPKTTTPYQTTTPCGALTTSNQICKWLCYENKSSILTAEDIKAIKEEIRRELQVDKSTLSSTKRKLISVRDSRPSAQAIGWLGGLFLGLFVVVLTVGDVPYFYLVLKTMVYRYLKMRATIKLRKM